MAFTLLEATLSTQVQAIMHDDEPYKGRGVYTVEGKSGWWRVVPNNRKTKLKSDDPTAVVTLTDEGQRLELVPWKEFGVPSKKVNKTAATQKPLIPDGDDEAKEDTFDG